MKTRVLCVLIVIALAFMTFHALFSEPRYHGRTLTRWLQQYDYTRFDNVQRRQEALTAIQAIGVKQALPTLFNLIEAKDDPVSSWLVKISDQHQLQLLAYLKRNSFEDYKRIRWQSAEDFQDLGVAGFELFGTNAAPAIGKLEKLLDEKNYSYMAECCLARIGKPAEPVICGALMNQDSRVRQWSIGELASVTDDVGVYIDRIKGRLKDSSAAVRVTVVDAIGLQNNAPELAVPLLQEALNDPAADVRIHAVDSLAKFGTVSVPLLLGALNDPTDDVRAHAANSLANFGTNALAAFPLLTNLVSRNGNAAGAALKTLIVIAPDAAFPILTNCLAQGKPEANDAIRALANVRPEKALPILLTRLQSPDLKTKHTAFNLLLHYPATPEIESAMQTIATGSDDYMVSGAKGFLTDLFETNHPNEFFFANEPNYGGKSLGEWLASHNDDEAFIKKAQDAVQHMGTNVIPALFKRLTYTRPAYCFSALNINLTAVVGFIALGEQAKPALPELWQLMDSTNKEVALCAMISTVGTGSNAMPFFIKGLTNQFSDIRNQAASTIADTLNTKFPEQVKPAIPLFVKLLNDPDDDVRGNATNQLKEIAPAIAAKLGIK